MSATVLDRFLRSTRVVDWQDSRVLAQAKLLAGARNGERQIARACFEWVRDQIPHTLDHGRAP